MRHLRDVILGQTRFLLPMAAMLVLSSGSGMSASTVKTSQLSPFLHPQMLAFARPAPVIIKSAQTPSAAADASGKAPSLPASTLGAAGTRILALISQEQYDAAVVLLEPLVARDGRATQEGAAASYLLAYVLYDGGWYVRALAEAAALQRVMSHDASIGRDGLVSHGNLPVTPKSGVTLEEVATLVSDLRPLAAQETRLAAQVTVLPDPPAVLCARGDLASFRGHFDEAASLYVSAYMALRPGRSSSSATRERVERHYIATLLRRPYTERAALRPLALRLLTADSISTDERRLGLAAASAALRQKMPEVADAGLADAAHTAVAELLGTRPALDSGFLGGYVMALCRDARGGVWVGTEGQGVWHFDPNLDPKAIQGHWTQFTAKTTGGGLGDDGTYALCLDRLGRVWAGTTSHGVSVYNGTSWKNYDQVSGPLGAHVTALTVSPADGAVWMGSEIGLARYADGQGWRYWTQADGLPSNQITCLAFASTGSLYVGTDCAGLAIGSAKDSYTTWRHVPGPLMPANQGKGSGLPSALINALVVSKTGTVYCGTDAGLGWSSDRGLTWAYRRGADWLDMGSGAYRNGLTGDATLSAVEVSPASADVAGAGFAVAAAGGAAGKFLAPRGFTGGQETHTDDDIDAHGISAPAPQTVYQHERQGTFAWTASGLTRDALYKVRLHFAERADGQPGTRVFSVFANGAPVLDHLDLFKAAGGKNKAVAQEFAARADGLGRIVLSFQGANVQEAAAPSDLLDDYIIALAEDAGGRLWIGHQRSGVEALDEVTGARVWPGPKDVQPRDYVTAILPMTGTVQLGSYGAGLASLPWKGSPTVDSAANLSDGAANRSGAGGLSKVGSFFPSPAAAPTVQMLHKMLERVQRLKASSKLTSGAYIGADWATEGDWVGRYGSRYAVLCAAAAPLDQYVLSDPSYKVTGFSGPHRDIDDGLRSWCQWVQTDDPRVLWDPITGYRRESEWDDHAESYPRSFAGPDVWAKVSVPAGLHRLSLYVMNKDGHDGADRFRDYLVELKAIPGSNRRVSPVENKAGSVNEAGAPNVLDNVSDPDALPTIAQARVRNFWFGVYERFLVRGPGEYLVKLSKNGSLNTILQTVMLDKISGPPTAYEKRRSVWYGMDTYRTPATTQRLEPSASLAAAQSLWNALDQNQGKKGADALLPGFRLLAYRAAVADPHERESASAQLLAASWRWQLCLWNPKDRSDFQRAMRASWQSLVAVNPKLALGNQ